MRAAVAAALCVARPALCEPLPEIVVEASVDADLRHIRGVLRTTAPHAAWVDALARLEEPPDDLHGFRTYPGKPSRGAVHWTVAADGALHFETELPRRFGALGATRGRLMANGAWYPQPIVSGRVPIARFDVSVVLPDGVTGALGATVGTGELRWTGTAERASLAAVKRGVTTELDISGGRATLLSRGRPRRVLVRELTEELARIDAPLSGVVVEGPLRRRLVRPGAGLAYVSDRAYRVTGGLQFAHRLATTRGVATAWLPVEDPFARQIAGAALGQEYADGLAQLRPAGVLSSLSWVPRIDALLSSRRMAFYAEVLELTYPEDRVADDLLEVLDPAWPGTAVVAQLDDTWGPGSGRAAGRALLDGASLAEAAAAIGAPPDALTRWRGAVPDQDYVLDVDRSEGRVQVTRQAPADAPLETVVVRIGDTDHTLELAPFETALLQDGGRVPPVRVDPAGHVRQTSRAGDSWPPRFQITLAGTIDPVSLTSGQRIEALGVMSLRRQYDTHNRWIGSLSTSRANLVAARITYLRKAGPLKDGSARPHRIVPAFGSAVLDPTFSEETRGDAVRVSLEPALSYAWDTRVSSDFPLRGQRLSLGVSGGVIPGAEHEWASARTSALGVAGVAPRHALAGYASLAIATSTLPQRLLLLGDTGVMRSLPARTCPAFDADGVEISCSGLATHRALLVGEYRWAALRNVSVPLWLTWGTELQLTLGGEAALARVDAVDVHALGATAGIYGLADALGLEAVGLGFTLGWPLAWHPDAALILEELPLQVTMRFAQEF